MECGEACTGGTLTVSNIGPTDLRVEFYNGATLVDSVSVRDGGTVATLGSWTGPYGLAFTNLGSDVFTEIKPFGAIDFVLGDRLRVVSNHPTTPIASFTGLELTVDALATVTLYGVTTTPVPEPGSAALLLLGLVATTRPSRRM